MGEPTTKKPSPSAPVTPPLEETTPLLAVQQAIQSIRFGTVQIVIQDGRIVQIDKTEKIRLV